MPGIQICVLQLLLLFLAPRNYIPEGKILKTTKQVRPQRLLLGGESAVEGVRISRSRATDCRCNRDVVSLVSSVTAVIRYWLLLTVKN